jgi:hypothetical protein
LYGSPGNEIGIDDVSTGLRHDPGNRGFAGCYTAG